MTAARSVGPIMRTFFSKIDDVFRLIGRLSRALRAQIDEVAEAITGAYNRVLRRSAVRAKPPRDLPCFTQPPNATRAEFLRQLREQENAINNTDISVLQARRAAASGAGGTAAVRNAEAQREARAQWLADRIAEIREVEGLSATAARDKARQEASALDATHVLNIVAGGDPDDISGLGDRSTNRSIGSQWRTRVTGPGGLDDVLADQARSGAQRPHIRMRPC